ncbi:hypothetical protein TWF225_006789 [Orbilia oligospora]|uniref:Uncharacterized protein n=1 Tax=Orbilia oligospora TaxID=2813651 RepID=A0A7C8PF76_ORBOL|nr:hypothetical protein TWF751_009692 [Orbilia oligospora]KAF3181245.1 hypothetical protein TWF225_006789 [Orbilia oligospora]KAF3242920.1 hypothetical protein TWF128_010383 [Orbilia oligospora]KAF3260366.1 hypothetical protein TWF217_004937 [Orbilia oligospora]KAF3278694.1 hypothetical protein TWF132_000847 [Orbilia oligospora]
MKCNLLALAFGVSISAAQAAETILGVYILSRHGDRTDKSHPPTKLTNLGYSQILASGEYFRNRYVAPLAPQKVIGVASDEVVDSQIHVSTTDDAVLLNSAQAFLQGLYPAVGALSTDILRNGSVVSSVNGGYQLIPIHTLNNGVNKEDATWLQGTSGCDAAIKSSKAFSDSKEFKELKKESKVFYQSLEGVWSDTFTSEQSDFTNAYAIYDVVNYALTHNQTIPSPELLTDKAFLQLRTLADKQQWNLAFNASEPVRAIAGATFAADVLSHLESIVNSKGSKPKIGIQFNAYGTFLSFFGLAQLPAADADFYGLPDYGSSMAFELFTNEAVGSFPDAKDINVRFLFHNGSTTNGGELTAYPLFGQEETELRWEVFAKEMRTFSITTTEQWCHTCGNKGGVCATASNDSRPLAHTTHHGLSAPVAGAVGALVTLVVILIIQGLIIAIAGLAIVKKKDIKGKKPESLGSAEPVKDEVFDSSPRQWLL